MQYEAQALSSADPGRPIDWEMASRSHAAWKAPAVYSLPWSVWKMTPGTCPPRTATAIASPVGQVRVVVLAQREPEHPARSRVQHRIEVEPALIGVDIGAVAIPLKVLKRYRADRLRHRGGP